ncbi:MAG: hypothetical protein O7B81_14450 [Gammaproteobacteria bacterium]|nr:hypothetical protein [Gammaproteobacteria bacterium]
MLTNPAFKQALVGTGPAPVSDQVPSFLTSLSKAVSRAAASRPFQYATTIHPCIIKGVRTLVHRRGLGNDQPGAFRRLKAYALKNGFKLLEERRRRQLGCRDERRRLAPVLMFAAGLVASSAMAEEGVLIQDGAAVVPTIEVIGHSQVEERPYLIEAGKRFVSAPHGEIELIMSVASEVRAHGKMQRVRIRGVQMPSEYSGSFIDRYDYQMPQVCGGKTFSYYEGDGFAALGFHADKGKVVLDVLAGGGPFTTPRLWGTYDQVLNSNIRMDLMFGDGEKDGMGLLKASYKIGLMPVMRTGTKNYYGELYSRAVAMAADCSPPLPEVRHAGTAEPKDIAGDGS